MDKLRGIWKTSSVDESYTPVSGQTKKMTRVERSRSVEEIRDDQSSNPYTEIQLLQHHSDIVRFLVKVSATWCVSGGDDGSIVVWDVSLGRKMAVLNGHSKPITCVLVLTREYMVGLEESVLLTAAADRQIKVWNVHTGECIQSLSQHCSYVKCLVSMRENLFISGGEVLCVWNTNGDLLSSYSFNDSESGSGGEPEILSSMIAIKDERLVVAFEKQLMVYQLTDEVCGDQKGPRLFLRTKLLPHREAIQCLVNISASTFASGSLDGTVVLWGAHTLSRCRNFNSKPDYQDSLKSFPYSVQHVFCMEDHYIFAAVGNGFHVYDLAGHILAEKVNAHYSKIIHMTFVYDGVFLATCSEDGSIRLWQSSRCPRVRNDYRMGIVERFLGVTRDEFSQLRGDNPPEEPLLVGECLGHSGAVLNLVDFGEEGFVSCGMDKLAILWRDGIAQSLKRTDIVHEMINGATGSL